MSATTEQKRDEIERAIALARVERPAYSQLYDFLEALLISQVEAGCELGLDIPSPAGASARSRWQEGFPLLNRWDFPIDTRSAARFLEQIQKALPEANAQLINAARTLSESLADHSGKEEEFWSAFLQHEIQPWEEWVNLDATDLASVLFVARSAIRPSLELTAEKLLEANPIPDSWLKGYCPVCGSLPSLLYLQGEGERKAFCSWCGTKWDLHRLQCPYCENRYHESLGYIAIEAEPQNRVVYCTLCKFYFKQIDTRESAYFPYLPLEEWTTLHVDLVAQKTGYSQPPSPSPAVYGHGK